MPIIYTYPTATPVSADLLIFSDTSETDPANATRSCTVGDLVSLVGDLVPGGGTAKSIELDLGDTGLTTDGEKTQTITTTGSFDIAGTLKTGFGGTGTAAELNGVVKGGGEEGVFSASDVVLTSGASSEVTGVLPLANGGLGLGSFTKGDIVYFNEADTSLTKLSIGDTNDILTVLSGVPAWGQVDDIAVTSIQVAGGSTGLTFSGGPITTTGTITMAGTLVVASGGTGAATFTSGGILYGNGTSAVQVTSQPTNGQLLTGSTGTNPVLNTLTAGTNITITNTAGDIEIAATGINGIYNGSGSLSGDTTITTGANDLTFTATTGNVTFNNASSSPTFFIDGASNKIGIGTASPNAVLDVTGDAIFNNSGNDNDFRVESVDNQHMLFVDAGNNRIGVNTSTPEKDLHIQKASGETTIRLENAGYWSDIHQTGANLFIQNAAGSGNIIFYDDSAERMRIDTNGKVGIGTASPSANADLTLEGGAIALKETTTPTADAGYGKIYCKADNLLYFQDPDGTERQLAFT
jgi:hypothetical protein